MCRCTQGIRDRPVSGATGSNRSESGSGPIRSGPNPEPIGFGPRKNTLVCLLLISHPYITSDFWDFR